MTRLYHLTLRDDLEAAAAHGQIAPGPEGFVHLSAGHQVAGTVARFYADVPPGELAVLELETDRLSAVVWEEGEPGVEFPHLYAPDRARHGGGGADLEPRARRHAPRRPRRSARRERPGRDRWSTVVSHASRNPRRSGHHRRGRRRSCPTVTEPETIRTPPSRPPTIVSPPSRNPRRSGHHRRGRRRSCPTRHGTRDDQDTTSAADDRVPRVTEPETIRTPPSRPPTIVSHAVTEPETIQTTVEAADDRVPHTSRTHGTTVEAAEIVSRVTEPETIRTPPSRPPTIVSHTSRNPGSGRHRRGRRRSCPARHGTRDDPDTTTSGAAVVGSVGGVTRSR